MNPQFKKGILELCALTLLKNGDRYGYELAELIGRRISISEGTVYPMLKRMQIEGYFETYLMESPSGPARKYYRITPKGIMRQELLNNQWVEFRTQVESFLSEATK